ncbi:autoinducer binding domain-containing protein [Hoeflea sp. TYP-13]|uniref:helix-turn-helix transcriptional regulator n=1 Tax=Hoeflea sp. TYP-13 TaxID=3230023 RepID=UPI0034C5FF07
MMNWLEESSYREQDEAADINGRMDTFARSLGLEYFSYLVLSPPRNVAFEIDRTLNTSYPDEWIERYMALRYFEVDPVADLAKRMTRPFYWGQGRFLRRFKKPQRRVFDEAKSFDITYGLAIPVRGPDGELGVFNVISSNKQHLFDVTRQEHSRLFSAAFDTHELVMKEQLKRQEHLDAAIELSIRERECLSWTLEGKTAEDIAVILGLSVSTVNHHASTATHKMNGLNKHHAAVKALRRGLIH